MENVTLILLKKINNRFWYDVISAYSEILQLIDEDTEDFILSSTIFHNNKITISNKPIYTKEWGQKGVRNINDLIHETGAFLLQEEFERFIYNIKTNFVQFLGLNQAIMAYAGTHKITSFSKKNYMHHCCLQIYSFL